MVNPRDVSDSDVDSLARTSRSLVWALRRFGEREAGLSAMPNSEIEVLRAVAERPGSSISEIARALDLQNSNVSTTVSRLVDRGLLERRADPNDGRSHRIHQTDLARRNNALIDAMWARGIRDLLTTLSPEEAHTLIEAAPLLARLGSMPKNY
ncbi:MULTISPECIES: MarR family winged helix-turn-helix transcriptional regulator [unclassified Rhodococcus (in: high G+C Gram-positive bacteria)]|jgi:DNA-binding MarR family transcriptional regulator|uniref:MarR family winged helix-turn-helix transcriptional regulator n=1 Tax=unclassified Rhodococcus (in: high G+C Gram-positive bacteria) TaxID=192944 RepID=UPI00146CFF10|nr:MULTISPECIES: MarR family transcriptional regulator [unclassified Rhodococcus (in: high G+C Gram-positive bacteria)]MBF0661297.1 MarR family transcriptional regulator [Rhodococcus sp. (in: high G+C Gram-positive bacteria)]NMD94405.1 MarR family transcriptional regulator [Rhodococcus sp. BL-253-APC-6A1W]NME78440.1 MarR family transcriptional regulator [Rhodococcus sp. 105337]